jgi:hypothetical protein
MQKVTRLTILSSLCLAIAAPGFAAKIQGDTNLKDLQPFGSKDKGHKHQAYDLFFNADARAYTCRTDPKHSVNATDFVVGTQIHYEIDKNKAKIRTPEKKEVECKIVRVETLSGQTN